MVKNMVHKTQHVPAKIGEVIEQLRVAVKEGSRIKIKYSDDPIYMPLFIDVDNSIGVCFEVPKTFITSANRWVADCATLILEHPVGLVALVYIYPEIKSPNPLFDILWELADHLGNDLTMHCMPIAGLNDWVFISRDRIASLCREQRKSRRKYL